MGLGFSDANELLAQGRLSFAELRGKPIPPRWYLFYGYDKREVTDIAALQAQGDHLLEPNYYMGRMMISARAERLDRHENLMPATVVPGRPHDEPPLISVVVVADVYEVVGLAAKDVAVEILVGPKSERTRYVKGTPVEKKTSKTGDNFDDLVSGLVGGDQKTTAKSYVFEQKTGRIESLHMSAPVDERQQWDAIISVYTKNVSGAATRVAYHRLKMSTIPNYLDNNPRMPIWIPLKPTACVSSQSFTAAVLMNLERAKADELVRGKRKFVATREFEARCYLYEARNLKSAMPLGGALPSPAIRVSCTGVYRETTLQKQTSNPVFLECLRLPCRLATDPTLNLPTVAPIVIDVFERRPHGKVLIGRATCRYDRVRGKENHGSTAGEALRPRGVNLRYDRVRGKENHGSTAGEALRPRWVNLMGGHSLSRHCGDILVCLEIVPIHLIDKIPAQPMRPNLKMCTVVVSCLGLRDLFLGRQGKFVDSLAKKAKMDFSDSLEKKSIKRPLLLLTIPSFGLDGQDKIQTLVPWNPPNPSDPMSVLSNKSWKFSGENLSSFDFFEVVTMQIPLPENPVYDPTLTIQVFDKKIKPKYLIGESTIQLLPLLPWVKDVKSATELVVAQDDFSQTINIKAIGDALRNMQGRLQGKQARLQLGITAIQEADSESHQQRQKQESALQYTHLDTDHSWILPNGIPKLLLAAYHAILKAGFPVTPVAANMFTLNVFIPNRFVLAAEGDNIEKKKNDEFFRPSVDATLEEYLNDITFSPLTLKKQISGFSSPATPTTTGTVRLAVGVDYSGDFRYDLPDEVAKTVFDEKLFRKKYRGEDAFPVAIRVRAYIIRAIALVPRGGTSGKLNPYLSFGYGANVEGLRGSAKTDEVSPDFFWLQECDVQFPDQSHMEISVWSKDDRLTADSDTFIGKTVVDLEERWFSKEWQRMMGKNKVPIEYRTLYADEDATTITGTLEMWLELMSPTRAAEVPRFELKESMPTEVELRIILWGARSLSFTGLGKNSVDALVTTNLDCASYKGDNPTSQDTDVHYNSLNGSAIYNWRIVYPRIQTPISNCVVQLSVYDFKPIGSSFFIGEVNLELRKHLERVSQTLSSVEYDAELKLTSRQQKQDHSAGFVQVTVQIIAQAEASYKNVGLGREEPNRDPKLTTPVEGRKWEDFLKSAGLRRDFTAMW
eukprot:CAMPEP_0113854392 /NCGR_PEP_ID=MMETSP0372-20130328/7288_1 /TAXON_ID=340204 /ORGANISM="Lankesteria abbotti" /LENGTH=1178 /DNA_ID=CAMNT_0000827543 /DNA_START=553 /DNA_END=4087 /DNA_ORIENTATION=- /assembly_acc=CAM_ASM_000359